MKQAILKLVFLTGFVACGGQEATQLPGVGFHDTAPVIVAMGQQNQYCRTTIGEKLCDAGLRCAHLKSTNRFFWPTWRCVDKENGPFEPFDMYYSEIDRVDELTYEPIPSI